MLPGFCHAHPFVFLSVFFVFRFGVVWCCRSVISVWTVVFGSEQELVRDLGGGSESFFRWFNGGGRRLVLLFRFSSLFSLFFWLWCVGAWWWWGGLEVVRFWCGGGWV